MNLHPYTRNPLKRALAEALLVKQGHLCPLCKERKILEIDHMDGNPGNWAFDNLRLLCHDCNIRERNLHQRSRPPERENEETNKRTATNPTDLLHNLVDYQGGGPEMQANDVGIPKWLDWLCRMLLEFAVITRFEAINKGATESGLTYQPIWRAYNKFVYQPEKESIQDPFAPFIEEKDERTQKRTIRLRLNFKIVKVGKLFKPVPKTEEDTMVLMKEGEAVKD